MASLLRLQEESALRFRISPGSTAKTHRCRRSRTAPRNRLHPSFAKTRAHPDRSILPSRSSLVVGGIRLIALEVHKRAQHLQVSDQRIGFRDFTGLAAIAANLHLGIAPSERRRPACVR